MKIPKILIFKIGSLPYLSESFPHIGEKINCVSHEIDDVLDDKFGVKSVIALPIQELERLEGQDATNKLYSRFKMLE